MIRTTAALIGAFLPVLLFAAGAGGNSGSKLFPDCSPKAVPSSVSVLLKWPCRVVPGQKNKFVLVMTNDTKHNLLQAQLVFARKSLVVKSDTPYGDQNTANPHSRVSWEFRNVPPGGNRSITLWLKFERSPGEEFTGYVLWLKAKPQGLPGIYRNWYATIHYVGID